MINKKDQHRLLIHNLMQNLQITFEEAKEELLRQKQEEQTEQFNQLLQIQQTIMLIQDEIEQIKALEKS